MPYVYQIPTYTCYRCSWVGKDKDVGKLNKVDCEGEMYQQLYCPECCNNLLLTEYEKINRWVDNVEDL